MKWNDILWYSCYVQRIYCASTIQICLKLIYNSVFQYFRRFRFWTAMLSQWKCFSSWRLRCTSNIIRECSGTGTLQRQWIQTSIVRTVLSDSLKTLSNDPQYSFPKHWSQIPTTIHCCQLIKECNTHSIYLLQPLMSKSRFSFGCQSCQRGDILL